jgi:hypothetical protein
MNVSLCDVDGHHFPNLALMKLSAWHKAQGDTVEWHEPLLSNPDRIYASKVFTFSADVHFAPCHPEPIKGGTGYRLYNDLPPEIDSMLPDYRRRNWLKHWKDWIKFWLSTIKYIHLFSHTAALTEMEKSLIRN